MINHPNRSQSAALRYVVYSIASMNALTSDGNIEAGLTRARDRHNIDSDLLVVFSTRSKDDLDRFDGGRWPKDAAIVWRGANELAQRYRVQF